jgi:hypothetical protein
MGCAPAASKPPLLLPPPTEIPAPPWALLAPTRLLNVSIYLLIDSLLKLCIDFEPKVKIPVST